MPRKYIPHLDEGEYATWVVETPNVDPGALAGCWLELVIQFGKPRGKTILSHHPGEGVRI